MQPFVPLFKNPHVQTIAGHFWPRPSAARRRPVEKKLYHTEPDVQVLVETERPDGAPRGEIVLVIAPPAAAPPADIADADPLLRAALTRASLKDAVSEVAQATGLPRREVYRRALALVKEEPAL